MQSVRALVLLLCSLPLFGAVAYDNSRVADSAFAAVTTLTTSSFTIGTGANRAAAVGLTTAATVTAVSVSCGGVSGTAVTNAINAATGIQVQIWQVINPPSGAQTCTATWTGAQTASLGVITATGVDQTTPLINGNNAGDSLQTASYSLSVTSTTGDLTVTLVADSNMNTTITSNQTKRLADYGNMDSGPGTGTTTHTWTNGTTAVGWSVAGANFKAAGAGGSTKSVRRGEVF